MTKTFRAWEVDQNRLFPPSVSDFVPEDHLAHFVRDLVRENLDLTAIHAAYEVERGQPPYHPELMTALLLYGYCRGVYSSRRIERACRERVDFMAVTGMAAPDHSTISEFRRRHLKALSGLFVQVLALCREAGLAKLGHVALDGTKMKANASKHKAMSYKRMKESEPELAAEVASWLEKAESADRAEDEEHGEDRRGDEMPDWVKNKRRRLEKMREAKATLEAAAKRTAEGVRKERDDREEKRGGPIRGPKPKALSGVPENGAQVNFTDPESRIMKVSGGYEQAYNCQAAVDSERQVIVATGTSADQNDSGVLLEMADRIEENTGEKAKELSADANYCSEANLEGLEARGIEGYVATGRRRHGAKSATSNEGAKQGPCTRKMRTKLKRGGRRSRYRLRKQVVEPVFGQMKEARGFVRFLLRGLENVTCEWDLLCTAHNILKYAGDRPGVRLA